MRQLVRTPGSYWTAFLKGYFGTIGVFGWAIACLIFEAPRRPPAQLIGLALFFLFAGSTIVGVVFLIRRLLSAREYRRVLEDGKAGLARDLPW
jgi:hypothetical protein